MFDNVQYRALRVKEGVYIPDVGTRYPESEPHQHIYHSPKVQDFPVDENYPFVDDSLRYRLKHWFVYHIILHIIDWFRLLPYGLRFHGREHLKSVPTGGAITVSNHCVTCDCESVLLASKTPCGQRIPMLASGFESKDGFLMHGIGGIPIPTTEMGMSAYKKFNAAFDEFHRRGYWFHIFPEVARWDFYKPLRPFEKGAFTMAYKYKMPIVPCAINFRPRRGIYHLIGRLYGVEDKPLVDVTVLEPVLVDTSRPRAEEVERLREVCFQRLLDGMGIIENPWPCKID